MAEPWNIEQTSADEMFLGTPCLILKLCAVFIKEDVTCLPYPIVVISQNQMEHNEIKVSKWNTIEHAMF